MTHRNDAGFKHEKWSSPSVFLLASVGAAVGLGNLWRFPFMTGQNGGAAFVLVYVAFVVLLCIPIIMIELAMGRRGQGSAITTMRKLTSEAGANPFWHIVGWLSLLVPLLGASYYCVVAGWSIDYTLKAALNSFSGFTGADSESAFNNLLASPLRLLLFHGLFIASVVMVVARGVGKGIEVAVKYMMPALFLILILLAINSVINADIVRGIDFLFNPDFSKITPAIVFLAMGQALFSVAVGVGVLMTFGAYVPANISLPKAAITIAFADTLVALLAGIAIFPVVFANGLDPADGPGLIFVTLPIAFGNMQAGYFIGLMFFVLLFFAAFSTVIGMIEPVVSWLEERRSLSRAKLASFAGALIWVLGIAAALSFNVWAEVRPATFVPLLREKGVFDVIDFFVANLLLPLNAFLIAVFAGWVMSRNAVLEELGIQSHILFGFVRFVIRYVAPVAIIIIFYSSLS